MISVDVKQLIHAVEEAGVFAMPEMSEGTKYLYDNLYMHLSRGDEALLSKLDFEAFEPEDIDFLNNLHNNTFEKNQYTANCIISTFRQITPICRTVYYV